MPPSRRDTLEAGSEQIHSLSLRHARLVASILLFGWLAYLIVTGQPSFRPAVLGPTLLQHALFLLLAAAYAVYLAAARRLPGPTPVDFAAAALIVVYAAAVVFSIYPRISLEASLPLAAALLTFYAFHDFRFLSVENTVRGLAVAGLAAAALGLLRVAEDYARWIALVEAAGGRFGAEDVMPPAVPRVRDASVLVNVLAMALNLTWPFALLLAIEATRRWERALWVLTGLLILLTLFFTLSRGAWLGTAGGIAVFAALLLLRSGGPSRWWDALARSRRATAVVGGIVLLVLAVGALVVASRWDSRPEWLFRASVSPRYDALETGWEIFRQEPLFGSGPYTYPLLYNAYSGEYPIENIHPHNGYLNVLVDTGLAGALALLAAGVLGGGSVLAAFRARPQDRLRLAACLAALSTLAIHALVDSPNAWSTALLPLAVVLALTMRISRRETTDSASPARKVARAAPLALIPLLGLAWTFIDLPHRHFDRSAHLLQEGHFEEALESARRAVDQDGSNAAYQTNAGVQEAIAYILETDRGAPGDLSRLDRARRHFQRALRSEPRSAIAYANLAVVEGLRAVRQGERDFAAAVDAARSALDLAPGDGVIAGLAGSIFEQAGLSDEAADAYARAIEKDPGLVQSPFWRDKLGLREEVLRRANGLTACDQGRVTAIYRGYEDDLESLARRCREHLAEGPGDAVDRSSLAIVLQALGRDDEARREAEAAAAKVPDNPLVLTARAIVNCGSGDVELVRADLARAAYQGDQDAALLLAYTFQPPGPGNPVPENLRLPVAPGPLPDAVYDRIKDLLPAAAPMVFDGGSQNYLLGILYYRVRFWRESPSTILTPGPWLTLVSPRVLFMLDMVRSR